MSDPKAALALVLCLALAMLFSVAQDALRNPRMRASGGAMLHAAHFDHEVTPSRWQRRAMHVKLRSTHVLNDESGHITVAGFKARTPAEMMADFRPISGGAPTLKELGEAMTAKLKEARDIAAAAEARGDQGFTEDERARVKAALEGAAEFKVQIENLNGDAELKSSIATFGGDIEIVTPEVDLTGGKSGQLGKGATLGARFTDSPEFKAFMKQFPNGRIPESAKGLISPPVEFKGLDDLQAKALVTGASGTSGGALVTPQDLGVQDFGTFQRPLTIRDIITVGRTGTDAVEYVRVTGFTNAAAPVAEATSAGVIGDGTGGTITEVAGGRKPESSMTMSRETANVKTIAHWIPATKQALSDAAQIRTLIDAFLRYGLDEELEDQIVNGDGTGQNFEGITAVSGVQAQAWDTDLLTTTRKGRTKVRTVGRAVATAYVFHPNDWERIDLLTDDTGRYYFGGPAELGRPRLWGLPVVESEAVTEGVGYVGDWRQCVLWDREQASIQVSDSHSDFFVRNMVAILAELRAAFGIFRPSALVEIDLTA